MRCCDAIGEDVSERILESVVILKTLFNDSFPVSNDCSLGRYNLKKNWIELLDRDRLVVL